ncbi:MAG TPA: polyprenyl synthetase family protein [Pyrinomonadaceae bacterium]|nr:polyprenyl synthetase family protein [Pyrinomonadaceae bacterium]
MTYLLTVRNERADAFISSSKRIIDEALYKYLHLLLGQSEDVREAAVYTIKTGGHRWRPILLLTVGRSYGAPDAELLPMACVVELLHTAAMILDDLPCMDDANLRHGHTTCHRVFGEDVTTLASHFLLTTCFEIVRTSYRPWYTGELTALITDMIRGQAADLKLKGRIAGRHELEEVYRLKSGRLAGFSAKMGAALAEASADEIERLNQFGETLGLAYQILDDLFDANGGPPDVGKEPGKDIDKSTFVTLFGNASAAAQANVYKEMALEKLTSLISDVSELQLLTDYIVPSPYL